MVARRCAITSAVRPAWPAQRLLHHPLILRIERGGRFVEEQDRRITEDGAGNGNALALAARKRDAPLADAGFEALLELFREGQNSRLRCAACRTASSLASGRARRIFSEIVPAKITGSCGTTAIKRAGPRAASREWAHRQWKSLHL